MLLYLVVVPIREKTVLRLVTDLLPVTDFSGLR